MKSELIVLKTSCLVVVSVVFLSWNNVISFFFLICNLSLNSPDCELHQLFTQQLQMQLNEIETEKTIHTSTSIDDHRFGMRYDVKMFPWNQINVSNVLYRCQQAIFTYICFAYGVCIEILTSKQQKNFIWIKSVHKLKTYQPIRGKKAE